MDAQEIIESTTFYGCGDEAYEEWRLMCHLCYRLSFYGDSERIDILLKWIVEDAKRSKITFDQNVANGQIEESYSGVYDSKDGIFE